MAPLRSYSNWNRRSTDGVAQIEPYRRYYFLCEGANTESFYFHKLIDLKKQFGVHAMIDICLLEKEGEDRNISYPWMLLERAEKEKENSQLHFDKERDKMILVFDADIFEEKVDSYMELLKVGREKGNWLAVTNPAFELFLLLHCDGSVEEDILPHQREIIQNEKVGNQRYIHHLLSQKTGMNAKKNPKIGELAGYVREQSLAMSDRSLSVFFKIQK